MEFILRTKDGTKHLSIKGRIASVNTEPMRFASADHAIHKLETQPDFADLVVDVAPAAMPVGVEV
jgi:hypothetical protein